AFSLPSNSAPHPHHLFPSLPPRRTGVNGEFRRHNEVSGYPDQETERLKETERRGDGRCQANLTPANPATTTSFQRDEEAAEPDPWTEALRRAHRADQAQTAQERERHRTLYAFARALRRDPVTRRLSASQVLEQLDARGLPDTPPGEPWYRTLGLDESDVLVSFECRWNSFRQPIIDRFEEAVRLASERLVTLPLEYIRERPRLAARFVLFLSIAAYLQLLVGDDVIML